jgi:alkylation response protein AidB-like acyl-CoA dehydrogenase
MDFSWTDEQLQLKNAVVEFAKGELNDDLVASEGRGEFSRQKWEKCARFGIQGLPIPEEYGGTGADILSTMLAMEGLGYGCHDNGLVFALNAQLWSVQLPIVTFGTRRRSKPIYPACAAESLLARTE